MDCYTCSKEIGSIDEPIFVLPDDTTIVCQACYVADQGHEPSRQLAQFDPDTVTAEQALGYFKSPED